MNIAQRFHKLRIISDVEIVVSLLPEMLFPTQAKGGLEWATHFLGATGKRPHPDEKRINVVLSVRQSSARHKPKE
jgi:hypothetical protein